MSEFVMREYDRPLLHGLPRINFLENIYLNGIMLRYIKLIPDIINSILEPINIEAKLNNTDLNYYKECVLENATVTFRLRHKGKNTDLVKRVSASQLPTHIKQCIYNKLELYFMDDIINNE